MATALGGMGTVSGVSSDCEAMLTCSTLKALKLAAQTTLRRSSRATSETVPLIGTTDPKLAAQHEAIDTPARVRHRIRDLTASIIPPNCTYLTPTIRRAYIGAKCYDNRNLAICSAKVRRLQSK